MVRPRLTLRSVRLAVVGVLAAAATLVASATPAQAATPTATISRWDQNANVIIIDAQAAGATIYLGWDGSRVTFRLPGDGFASWPADCLAETPVGLPDQYVHCPGVDALAAYFGPGNDTLYMDGVCIPEIYVEFGDGGNTMQGDTNCNTFITSVSGAGDDIVQMASGGGTATLGGGNDQFRGGAGNESASGGPGNDSLSGNGGNDSLFGEDGSDAIAGAYGNDVEAGGNGDDVIGNYDDDQGADDVSGGPGVDKVWFSDHTGGGMAISLDDVANDGTSGEGDNVHSDLEIVVGSPGDDTITGTAAPDNLDGYFGADTIRGGPGNDRIDGNSDNDQLFGEDGDDEIYGGAANDKVDGGAGSDLIFGDSTTCCLSNGSDTINSVDGAVDQVNCGGGPDIVTADTVDVVSQDALQLCESVTRTEVAPPPGTVPPPATTVPHAALAVQAAASGKPRRSKGVLVATTCSATCSATAGVAISKKLAKKYGLGKKVLIGLAKGASASGGKFTIKVKIKAKARAKLAKAGTIPAVVLLVVADAAGVQQTRSFKIKLRP